MANILIIDDEARHCDALQQYLIKSGHHVSVAGSAEHGCEIAAVSSVDAVLLDVRLPGMDGLTAISRLRGDVGLAPIIIMTAFGTLDTAAAAVRAGVFDYLVKPFTLLDLKAVLARALHQNPSKAIASPAGRDVQDHQAVIGRSPVMQKIFNRVALAAAADVPVLLTGESGTGKEILAHAIHRYSSRNTQPFIPVFLAALSPGLIESEIFGHVRGAFTGAELQRTGLLEQASKGTAFLDEIGDIPLPSQVKLLRAIDRKEITRVGEDTSREIDVRFVAATNRSLTDMIHQGTFREDLFYRLSVYHIELPPLRDRREDISELAHYFLRRISAATNCPGFSAQAISLLESRPWPGNVRELRNAVEHAAIACRGALIDESHLPATRDLSEAGEKAELRISVRPLLTQWINRKLEDADPLKLVANFHEDLLQELEPILIEIALDRCRGNQSAACRILGMDPKTLRAKCKS